MSECAYPNCRRECADGPCPVCRDDDTPICKDRGGPIGMNGECLYCTAEAGEVCKGGWEMIDKSHSGKVRHCWNCGDDMGFIEDRYYDRSDTCGSPECERAARDAAYEERAEAHDQLDRDMGWS